MGGGISRGEGVEGREDEKLTVEIAGDFGSPLKLSYMGLLKLVGISGP